MADEGAASPRIRVVWGTATGPTAVAAYDAALAAANVHDYNLARLSSVVPPGATVTADGTAPDLGPVGNRLWVVDALATDEGPAQLSAALGWATAPEGGVFYEAAGAYEEDAARARVATGLSAARELRGAALPDETVESVTLAVPEGVWGTAVVLAAFGESESLFP